MFFRIFIIAALVVASFGCGGTSGGSKLDVAFNGSSASIDIKSSGVYPATKTFSFTTAEGQTTITKAVNHYVALANYELETKGPVTMGAPLKTDGQTRAIFQIVGSEGTDEKAAVKIGTYPTKCEKYNCVDYLSIARFTGGKEEAITIDVRKAEGEVKITSVTEDTISGEINITEGQHKVNGPFTAKITTKRN